MPSASLVPAQHDPSALLISAGMHPLKPYFLGHETPPHHRLTTLPEVLPDARHRRSSASTARHHTFFEMLGNFSIGDYFKQGADRVRVGALAPGLRPRPRAHLGHGLRGRRGARPRPGRGGDRGVGRGRASRASASCRAPRRRTSGRRARPGRAGRARSSTTTAGSSTARRTTCPGERNERFLEYWNLVFMQYNQDPVNTPHAAAGAEHRHRARAHRMAAILQDKRLGLRDRPVLAADRARAGAERRSATARRSTSTARCGSSPTTRAGRPSSSPTASCPPTRTAATCCAA